MKNMHFSLWKGKSFIFCARDVVPRRMYVFILTWTQEDIGAHFDLDKGRIARNLSELEEKGLVCRVVNESNKRQKLVSLTSQGRQVLSGIDRIFEEWDAVCFSGFTEQERCLYQDFVKRIAENAMEYRHSQINQKEGCTYDK